MGTVYWAWIPLPGESRHKVANPDSSKPSSLGAIASCSSTKPKRQAVRHPNIVAVYDAGVEEDIRYIVMEYIPDHGTWLICQPENLMPLEDVVEVMLKCAVAFDYAHRKGLFCDIKPKNILLTQEQEVKVRTSASRSSPNLRKRKTRRYTVISALI